tara:strand:- start:6695 stop:7453 length:759 start_codon:yes stop_codon:yes gene_type:complete
MSASSTMIAELPETNKVSAPVNIQQQSAQIPQMPQQNQVSTQQISNEFYGHISAQPQFPQQQSMGGDDNLNYKPINVHPNPYGTPQVTPDGPPLPEPSPQRNQQPVSQQNYTIENMPQQSLPSRDIPLNTMDYQHDEQIQANHIPSVKLTSDYIKDYEKANREELRMHREQKYRQEKAQETVSEFQIPILVAVMYFIFQIPIINTWMRKYLAFANLHSEDGNFRVSGLLFKSALFGGLYYFLQSLWIKLSNI